MTQPVESIGMDELPAVGVLKKTPVLRVWLNRVLENPVVIKELRGRMRGRRAFFSLTAYLILIGSLIALIYAYLSAQLNVSQWDLNVRQGIGKTIFSSVITLEFLMIGFIGPALTAGALTSEREHQTYDLLRTTLLSARALVLGKLGSAFMYLFLLVFTALPIEALAFLLGGVGIEELSVASLMLVTNAVFFCALGLFFSSFMKRTLSATVASYGSILGGLLALGLVLALIIYLSAIQPYRDSSTVGNIALVILWFLACSNPFSAAVVSELFLIQNQTLFLVKLPLLPSGSNLSIYLPSPWILHIGLYLVLAILMVVVSIRFVERPDR